MDAQQGMYVSPDGRHRWDTAAQRWVPVELSAPRPPAAPAAPPPPAAPAAPAEAGGWGKPVAPGRSTLTGWSARSQPWTAAPPPSPPPPEPASPPQPAWSPPPPWRASSSPQVQPQPWGPAAPPARAGAALAPPWTAPSSTQRAAGAAASPGIGAAGAVAAGVGGVGLVLGAFLAWISASAGGVSTSQSGINTPSGDGWFFVVVGLAVVAAALGAFVAPKAWLGLIAAAGALAAAGLTSYEFADVHGHIRDAKAAYGTDVGSYGIGLYLLAIGSLLALAGGLAEARRARGMGTRPRLSG